MTFIGTETQPPVNQSQTGHYNATRLLVQPPALNAVRRFLWTALTLKVRQLFSQALSHSFLLILFFLSAPPISLHPISLL